MRSTPLRTCVSCRERRPQAELVRIAGAPLRIRIKGEPGRSGYVCARIECIDRLAIGRGLDRALRIVSEPDERKNLIKELRCRLT